MHNALVTGRHRPGSSSRKARSLHHTWVQFQIKDVLFPKPSEILLQLHEQDCLQGRLVDLSDRGDEKDAFAMIKVEGLQQIVVVPARHVQRYMLPDTEEAGHPGRSGTIADSDASDASGTSGTSGTSGGGGGEVVDSPPDQPDLDIETMPDPYRPGSSSEKTGEMRDREEP